MELQLAPLRLAEKDSMTEPLPDGRGSVSEPSRARKRWFLGFFLILSGFCLLEDSRKDGHGAVNVLFGEDIGRQHAQDGVVRAIEQDAFLHGVEDDLLARNIQFDAHHQAEAANFLDEGDNAWRAR